jgi:predicted nucleic acid-binding protein
MTTHLTDTNVFSEIFKGKTDVKKCVEGFESSIDTTVYVECLQGSKGNREKQIIRKYLSRFPIFYHTPDISKLGTLCEKIRTHIRAGDRKEE